MDPEFKKELQEVLNVYYPREWMNKKQTIKYIGIANNTFDSKFKDLPFHIVEGLVRYSRSEIDAFIKKH